jgi:transcriptional regulator with XRE-family HTH domain
LSRIERGAYEPALSSVCALAFALGVSLDDLLQGVATPTPVRTKPRRDDIKELTALAENLSPRAVRLLTHLVKELAQDEPQGPASTD